MVSEATKQFFTPIMLEMPILLVALLKDQIIYMLVQYTYSFETARMLYVIIFIMAGLLTGFMALIVQINAQKAVAGKRFLVGIVYDRNGIGKRIQKELGVYSFMGEIKYNGDLLYAYAVWKIVKKEKVIDYIIILDRPIEKAFNAASRMNVYVAGWYAKAQTYPVSMLKMDGKAIDVLKEKVNLDQRVDIYVIRDYPGRISKVEVVDK